MSDVFNSVAEIICDVCSMNAEDIKTESNIVEDLGIDSIDFLDVAYEIEKKYAIKIPVETWMELVNTNKASLDDFFVMGALVKNLETLIAARSVA